MTKTVERCAVCGTVIAEWYEAGGWLMGCCPIDRHRGMEFSHHGRVIECVEIGGPHA